MRVSQRVPPKLVLLDTNGLIYRAFYALPYLTTSDGRPTNAVYGLVAMVLKVLEEERPDYIAAAFDLPAPTFRHREFADYKAHREAMPDDLRPQIALSKQALEALGIPVLAAEGFEAEDVIATVARYGKAEGFDVLVVSGDLDTLQLVDDQVRVMVTSRGLSDTVVYDEARVRERFGFTPEKLPDYKSLRGDPSDNIPGVPGVGEKTASGLIQRFGSVEAVLEHLDELPERTRAALSASREQVLQSKRLATIVDEAPVEPDWPRLRTGAPDPAAVEPLFRDLEFRGFLARLRAFGAASPGEASREGVPRVASEDRAPESRDQSPDPGGLESLASCLEGAHEIGVALIRGDGHPLDARLLEAGVAAEPSDSAPARAAWVSVDGGGLPPELRSALEDPAVRKVSPDLKSDLILLRRVGVEPQGFDFDVSIASYLLNPGRRTHTLQTASQEFLGEELAGGAAEAARALILLRPILQGRMREQGVLPLFRDVEVPLAWVLAEMEEAGVAIDVAYLGSLGEEMAARLDALEARIYEAAGTEFNIGSPKQLAHVLFEKLALPPQRRTKTGYSTDSEVLETLAPRHDIVARIVEYRALSKLKSTYVDVLPRMTDPHTGRVHTTFNQTLAGTGRVITEQPNLQNLPIRTEDGRRIRRAVVAPSGCVLLSVDYSQIDLRVLAHITDDPGLGSAFERGEDVHTVTAAEVFGLGQHQVTPELRRRAKAIVFGVAYGMSEHGLASQLGIPREEARGFIDLYYARFPGVREYMLRIVEQARRDGYVTTLLNRRRYLPDLQSRNRAVREAAERVAINTPIQGSSADIIKLAMLAISREVLPAREGLRMTLQIHDELLFEVPRGDVAAVAAEVRAVMERAYTLSVPLVAEAKAGPNWAEMRPLHG